jgi:hypothetical protein
LLQTSGGCGIVRGVDALTRKMQDELKHIRERDAEAPQPVRAESAIGELEWKMQGLMIQSGLVIGPIVVLLIIAGLLWWWLG